MVQYPDKYTRAIKIRNPLDRLNGFIYMYINCLFNRNSHQIIDY